MTRPNPGDRVTLNTPDNPRLHGAPAVVSLLAEWGALVLTPAAGTGQFRALWSEMEITELQNSVIASPSRNGHAKPPRQPTLTGDVCDQCGSPNMVRTGTCLTCQACGSSSGGCS